MQKGFTLIELLVVIAIIGILASIVLVSFPGATKKAKDSRIVSAIGQARTVMAFVYANTGGYTGFTEVLPVDDMPLLNTEVTNNGGTLHVNINNTTPPNQACIYSGLNDGKSGATFTKWYCSDSTGVAGFTSIDPATLCPDVAGAAASCPAVSG